MRVTVDAWAWLPKADLTPLQVQATRAALTIQPSKVGNHPGEAPGPIKLYTETEDRIGIPREYFLARRKNHEVEFHVTDGNFDLWAGPLQFSGSLRPEQQKAVGYVTQVLQAGQLGMIVRAAPGWGKSPALATPVLRYDGKVVRAEEVQAGDLLMGPDSTARRVLDANTGFGPMYRIIPTVGEVWECNESHILTLVHSVTDEVIDIALTDYLRLSAAQKHHLKQFSPEGGVDFPSGNPLPLDPYFLGVWYGDGTKALNGVAISKPDAEIEALCRDTAAAFGLRLRVEAARCPVYHIVVTERGQPNPLLDLMRSVFGDGRELPSAYLIASRADRMAFLAGWLDSDGYHNNGCYEIVQKRKEWADGIAFVARSLGIRAIVREKIVNGCIYWRVKLAGDFSTLPLRIARKLPRERKQRKIATRTGFMVERVADGGYRGILLDGDHRYLLGDFTVTHNTVVACALIAQLQVPTLVVVHKEFLVNQWKERIEQFLPGSKVGIIQQDTCDFAGKHIAIAMVHSLVSREYPLLLYRWPGLVITDEVHRIAAETWSHVPPKFPARWRVGISATPRRKDGADNVFLWHIGPVGFKAHEQRLKPKVRRVWTKFRMVETARFNPNLASKPVQLQFLCANDVRNHLVVDQLIQAAQAGRKIIVLSERLKHLSLLEGLYRRKWPDNAGPCPSTGFYIGGLSQDALDEAAKASVIFATSQLVSEGLDIPALDTIALTTPLSDVEQAVGRILRPCEGKKDPVVVDFRDDDVGIFAKYGRMRDKLYARIT